MRRYLVLLICFLFLISSVGFAQKSAKKRDYVKFDTARFAKGDIDGAISYFNKVIAVNPQFVAAYLKRGKARRALGDLDGAISDYDHAAELDPGVVNNNREAADAYAARGDVRWQKLGRQLDGSQEITGRSQGRIFADTLILMNLYAWGQSKYERGLIESREGAGGECVTWAAA